MDFGPLNEFAFLAILTAIVFQFSFARSAFVPASEIKEGTFSLKKGKNKRITTFDTMRGVAIVGVILIHVSYILQEYDKEVHTLTLQALDASMRFALPVFYITSGLLLKTPKKSIKGYISFIWERALKLLPAYILVNIVLAIMRDTSLQEFGYNLISGKGSVPFYFVVVLFQLYLMYPLIVDHAHKKKFVFATLWFSLFFQLMIPTWYVFGVPTAFRFLFFFVWGIYMREHLLLGRLKREWLPWFLIFTFCIFVYILLPGQYYNMRPFYGLAVTMLMYLMLTSTFRFGVIEKILSPVGAISFWIFLTHYPLMEYTLPYVWSRVSVSGYSLLLVTALVSIVASVLVGYFCTKIYNSAVLVFSGKLKEG